MPEQEASTAELRLPLSTRVRVGLRHGANWLQLVRFGLVGASGYVLNLAVFALCVHPLGIDYRVAGHHRVPGRRDQQLLVEPALDVQGHGRQRQVPGRALPRRLPGRLRARAAPAPAPGRRRGPAKVPAQAVAVLVAMPPTSWATALDLQVIVRAPLAALCLGALLRAGGLGPERGLAAAPRRPPRPTRTRSACRRRRTGRRSTACSPATRRSPSPTGSAKVIDTSATTRARTRARS